MERSNQEEPGGPNRRRWRSRQTGPWPGGQKPVSMAHLRGALRPFRPLGPLGPFRPFPPPFPPFSSPTREVPR